MEHTEHCKKRMKWGDGECECKHNVSASGSNELLCSMPRELTAENGAKGLLSGEFYVTTDVPCPACLHEDSPANCSCCEGVGDISQRTYVDWTTIKEIYAMAVKHLGT